MLAALAVGGYLFVVRGHSSSVRSLPGAIGQAESVVSGSNFQTVEAQLRLWFATNGTYAGAALAGGSDITVVRADAAGYCLQDGAGANAKHLVGPGGHAQPGPC